MPKRKLTRSRPGPVWASKTYIQRDWVEIERHFELFVERTAMTLPQLAKNVGASLQTTKNWLGRWAEYKAGHVVDPTELRKAQAIDIFDLSKAVMRKVCKQKLQYRK